MVRPKLYYFCGSIRILKRFYLSEDFVTIRRRGDTYNHFPKDNSFLRRLLSEIQKMHVAPPHTINYFESHPVTPYSDHTKSKNFAEDPESTNRYPKSLGISGKTGRILFVFEV